MATIREVAKAANVSITTVSKILSNDPDFRASQETRERVLKTAEELHYQYTGKKSQLHIGCIMSLTYSYSDPYFNDILGGIQSYCASHNAFISLIVSYSQLHNMTPGLKKQLSELDGMSKQQENSPTADFVPVDLGVLVKDVATNMTVNARKAYITLQYKVQPVTVRGSHDLLTELVTNLCDNAIRYNRPGGHVELSCGTNADGCPYFCVEDNGIGIPQDSQSRVFERFYRVDKSRSKATGGTGLGLAIVKHIAVLHGARIDLESTVGTGTTIRIIFPKM